MQIYCFTLAFYPVHTCNLQAISAMGRSDITLRLEIIKKSMGVVFLIAALVFFDSPIAIAMTGAITTLISCFINAFPNKKLIGYSYLEQMKDLLPNILVSIIMGVSVFLVSYLNVNNIILLLLQILTGVIVYVIVSAIFKLEGFTFLKESILSAINKRKNKKKKQDE